MWIVAGAHGRRRHVAIAAVVLALAVGLSGCGQSTGVSVDGSATTEPASTPTAVSATTSAAASATATAEAEPTPVAPSLTPTTEAPAPAPTTQTAPAATEASCPPPSNLLGKDLTRLPTDQRVVALTFDAGANADAVRPVLDTLRAKNVTGTFFLTGDFVQKYPAESKEIGAGYIVGNHSMTHPEMTKLSVEQMKAEVSEAEQAIRAATGRDPRPYFRFPLGDVNDRTISVVNDACYIPFRWTSDTLGWMGTSGGQSAASVRQRALDKLQPGEIVLMHLGSNPKDGSTLDADALPAMIDEMRARGYSFVSLDAALAG